jgi:hypothetical protein
MASTFYKMTFTATSSTATLVFTNTFSADTVSSDIWLSQASVMATSEAARHAATPLLLDLNDDGVHSVGANQGVLFDVNNSGTLARVGWADAHDGILVRDIDHDGTIRNGSELFGNGTLLADGSHAANGFDALAQFDANHDGQIDAQDAVFQDLQVWRDANGDGVSQADELLSLQQLGIASFNLTAMANATGENGNQHGLLASYTTREGAVHELTDVWFQQGAQFTLTPDATGGTTLHLSHADTLDLTTVDISRLQGVHAMDLRGDAGGSSVYLGLQQVLHMGSVDSANRHQLLIDGDSGDTVFARGGFTDSQQSTVINGHTYAIYEQGSCAQLLIERGVNVVL